MRTFRAYVAMPLVVAGLLIFSLGLFVLDGGDFASSVLRKFRNALQKEVNDAPRID